MSSSIGRPLRPTINAVPIAASTIGQSNASLKPRPSDCASSSTPSVTAPSAATCTRSLRATLATGAVVGREEEPPSGVEHDAGAAREREHHEREPHQVRLDVEVVADPAGDTGDELLS